MRQKEEISKVRSTYTLNNTENLNLAWKMWRVSRFSIMRLYTTYCIYAYSTWHISPGYYSRSVVSVFSLVAWKEAFFEYIRSMCWVCGFLLSFVTHIMYAPLFLCTRKIDFLLGSFYTLSRFLPFAGRVEHSVLGVWFVSTFSCLRFYPMLCALVRFTWQRQCTTASICEFSSSEAISILEWKNLFNRRVRGRERAGWHLFSHPHDSALSLSLFFSQLNLFSHFAVDYRMHI